MFADLIDLFDGWYQSLVSAISSIMVTEVVEDAQGTVITSTAKSIDVWSAYVPWEEIIAAVVLITFTVCIFKFMRSVLCKIL